MLTLAGGCSEPESVDILLVPGSFQSEAQLLERVERVELIVSRPPDGLYPSGSETVREGIEIVDADGDGALDLVAGLSVAERLPIIRLERGSFAADGLDFRVRGFDGPVETATGEVVQVGFDGAATPLPIVFNLRPEHQPLAVVYTHPRADAESWACRSIVLTFNQPIADIAAADITVEGAEILSMTWGPTDSGPTYVDIAIGGLGPPLPYDVVLSVGGLSSVDGGALDGDFERVGVQPFVMALRGACSPGMANPGTPCGMGECDEGGIFRCIDDQCIPAICGGGCQDAFVCDDRPTPQMCSPDCRLFGDHDPCPDSLACSEATGLCV